MPVERNQVLQLLKNAYPYRKLDFQQLGRVADAMEEVSFNAGQTIYEQGADAASFYLIYSGQVKVSRMRSGDEEHLHTHNPGDWFGEDGITLGQRRRTTAVAITGVVLLKLEAEQIRDLMNEHPSVREAIRLIQDSHDLFLKTTFSWRKPEEVVYFIARRHPFFLLQKIFLPILVEMVLLLGLGYLYFALFPLVSALPIAALIASILFVGWAVFAGIDWGNDYYLITNRRAIYQELVIFLYDSRLEAPMDAILSIGSQTDQIGRWIGYGDVSIKTYTGTIYFRQIGKPKEVYQILQSQWTQSKINRAREERLSMQSVVRARLNPVPPTFSAEPEKPLVPQTYHSGTLTAMLETFFQLRMVQGDTIIYRTHWYILIRKTFFPGALVLASIALIIARVFGVLAFVPGVLYWGIAVILFLGAVGWWLYQYIDWENDLYIITPDQVIDIYRKPLGLEDRRAAPLKNIQSIDYTRRGIIGLLLNFGTVLIQIGNEELHFEDVPNPSGVQQEIFLRFMQNTDKTRFAEQQRMVDWLEAYHQVLGEDNPDNPPAPGPFSG